MFVRNLELFGLLKVFGCVISVSSVSSTFVELAREARAVAFFPSGALFDSLAAVFLFTFFDSDTVDLHCRCIDVTRITRWNGHKHI